MITSNRQYKAAQEKLTMLKTSLKAAIKKGIPEIIAKAAKGQLQELISEIEVEIKEYVSICQTKPSKIKINSLDDLMVAPIRYRLASHMSVEAFARKVDISTRQIMRYEAENYQNTNTTTLNKILGHIKLKLKGKVA